MIQKNQLLSAIHRWMILCAVVLISLGANAQSFRKHHSIFEGGDDYHFGYISGSVGYSMLHTNTPNAMPYGGLGGAVGLGYEFRNSGFWANVGVQLSFHRSSMVIDEYNTRDEADQTPYFGFDTQNKPTQFYYRVNQRDEMQWNFIDIPLQVGYYIRGFHVGGGLKISYALTPTTLTKGTYNLSGRPTDYEVIFEDMPDQGYTDYNFEY